jgi:hypothetical protein
MTAQTSPAAAVTFPVYFGLSNPERCPGEAIADAARVIRAMNTLLNGFNDMNDLIRDERDGIYFVFDAVQKQLMAVATTFLDAAKSEGEVTYPHFHAAPEAAKAATA